MNLGTIGFYTMYDERVQNVSETSQMKRCEMIITEYCNFKCPYCRGLEDAIYGQRVVKQLALEEVKQNIDYWCSQGDSPLESIRFSGGEPTLHRDIVEIVRHAKAAGIKNIAISSNGSNKMDLYRDLIDAGVNDFSISLDACCADIGDKMAGGVEGAWDVVVTNIKDLSKICYVTVGVVLTKENINDLLNTIQYAHDLGVADIRVISAAQWDRPLTELENINPALLEAHPILKFRVRQFLEGKSMRGITENDSRQCGLGYDDSIIAGDYVFPCIIYMREQGDAICKVGPDMRKKKIEWVKGHDAFADPICSKNCLDVCVAYNNEFEKRHEI